MTEFAQLLDTQWAGAPLIIWLTGGVILGILLLTLIILCVGRFHVEWKTKKRLIIIETDNSVCPKNKER